LSIGLGIAVLLTAIAANAIANLLARFPLIAWVGWAVILYVALDMMFGGSREIACAAWQGVWCEARDPVGLIRGLLGR
jgi:predicted tellurium resistance membrane protein TerC